MKEILVPDADVVDAHQRAAAPQEHPWPNPFAVYQERVLSVPQCDLIVKRCLELDRDSTMEHCGAEVRPVPIDYLQPITSEIITTFTSIGMWWDFHIDQMSLAFMTYKIGHGYDWHVDIAPGVSRKLSASVQLSSPDRYRGGDLTIRTIEDYTMPRTLGTMIVFPAYMLHTVEPIQKGVRHSLVIATWGEPFR